MKSTTALLFMNHPNPDEWVPFLFDETAPEVKRKLAEHLEECAECQSLLARWRHSLGRLDAWRLPPGTMCPRSRSALLPWAAAAAVLLGLGLAFMAIATSRLNQVRAETEAALKTSLAAQLKPELSRELSTALQQHLQETRGQLRRELQSEMAGDLNRILVASVNATATETRRQLADFVQALNRTLETERRETLATLRQVQEQQATDYLGLRHDLETVAAQTDRELQWDRFNLAKLNLVENESKENKP